MTPTVVHVTGARPNFPKAAPVIDALRDKPVTQRLVHTGQHYDDAMSAVFFRQLSLPEPDVNLGVGSGTHAEQTAAIMVGLEKLFVAEAPDLVMVYGDVNSTVAAALVAAKLQIPSAHVEAGLRSFDWSMPEEVNRVVTDRLATLLLATSADAVDHLRTEGVDASRIHLVGNPMIDTLLRHVDRFDGSGVLESLGVGSPYAVVTLHRPANVDDPAQLARVVGALHEVADQLPTVLPAHPRGRQRLVDAGLTRHPGVHLVDPLGYLEFLGLVKTSRVVVTDSGGIQEESTVLGVPCLTMRPNTERPVTITHGTNLLVEPDEVGAAVRAVLAAPRGATWPTPPLWDGRAGGRIADVVEGFLDG
jgi:UDP-N-acetylglucosamine 2-epimerase (non-hydrolysing)